MEAMRFALVNLLLAAALFGGMLGAHEWGRRTGERHRRLDPTRDTASSGLSDNAVLALLGLLLAFTFSGAASRFDMRRDLVVQETNAIGTAWLRIDALPVDRQPHVRDLFRRYLDARLDMYRQAEDPVAVEAAKVRYQALQQEIWSASMSAATAPGQPPESLILILPVLNDMFDITTTREGATRQHPPAIVFAMLGGLALVSALFAGYGAAGLKRRWLHELGFVMVLTVAMFVIIDLEFPRRGFIRVDAADQFLKDLRHSMD
jgi:hypothetical protein